MNANELNELKGQVKKYVDLADKEVLQMVHAVLKAHIEGDWWDNVPANLKQELDESIYRPEEEVTTYEQVKKDYPHWFMN